MSKTILFCLALVFTCNVIQAQSGNYRPEEEQILWKTAQKVFALELEK